MGDTSMSLRFPDDVRVGFEVEVDGDEIDVEIELKWSRRSAEPAHEESRAEAKNPAERCCLDPGSVRRQCLRKIAAP
jgi:hypothetical protein